MPFMLQSKQLPSPPDREVALTLVSASFLGVILLVDEVVVILKAIHMKAAPPQHLQIMKKNVSKRLD